MIAKTPKPPYYAVIFSSKLSKIDTDYEKMSDKMTELAQLQPGFLGIESAREDLGITVSYWKSEQAILDWKLNVSHQVAQQLGKEKWYEIFKVRVAKVERDYEFGNEN